MYETNYHNECELLDQIADLQRQNAELKQQLEELKQRLEDEHRAAAFFCCC